jgi:hypothetical protein
MQNGGKRPNSGRPKGSPNKLSGTVKDNVIAVFDAIGGNATMAAWAEGNQTEFFRLYSKLLPTDVNVQADLTINWPLAKPKIEK